MPHNLNKKKMLVSKHYNTFSLVSAAAVAAAAIVLKTGTFVVSAKPFDTRTLRLLWNDEFNRDDALPRTAYWNFDDNQGPSGVGNGQIQNYTRERENVHEIGGRLNIRATRTGERSFASAGINSQNKVASKYTSIRARIRNPNVNAGLWPSFWTMGSNWGKSDEQGKVPWPDSGSMDIMELGQGLGVVDGVANQRVISAIHWSDNSTHASYAKWYDNPTLLNESYHIYAMDWTNESITTYIDDVEILKLDIRPEECSSCEAFHRLHFLVINMAVGGGFTADGCDSTIVMDCGPGRTPEQITAPLPATFSIDWVRIYDNGLGQSMISCPGLGLIPPTTPVAPVSPPQELPTSDIVVINPTTIPQPTTAPVTDAPVFEPTFDPTFEPSLFYMTDAPMDNPTAAPVDAPTGSPVVEPTTLSPVESPTTTPISAPTSNPVNQPSLGPTLDPTTDSNVIGGTFAPTPELIAPPVAAPSCTCPPVLHSGPSASIIDAPTSAIVAIPTDATVVEAPANFAIVESPTADATVENGEGDSGDSGDKPGNDDKIKEEEDGANASVGADSKSGDDKIPNDDAASSADSKSGDDKISKDDNASSSSADGPSAENSDSQTSIVSSQEAASSGQSNFILIGWSRIVITTVIAVFLVHHSLH